MGMIFSSGNLPNDLMANGAYAAFQILGQHFGVGNFLMIVYALTNGVGQIAALAFSIDAPLRILLADADPEFVFSWQSNLKRHRYQPFQQVKTSLLEILLLGFSFD